MEKITTKKQLIETLKDIKAVEEVARRKYLEDIRLFSNSKLKTTISLIKIDEDKHIFFLTEIIDMLENETKTTDTD